MSTDPDKEAFALKRNRGGDGGLEGLAGSGLLLGNPDKKKRKTNSQASSLAPLSEYAPPANPSSDHLVASNPFDDNYNSPPSSLKPLGFTNPYFGPSHFSGFSGYGPPPRMAPQIQNRIPSPYGGPYQMRNQPHLFPQNPMGQMGMGFSRPPRYVYGHHDNPAFTNQPMFNNNNMNLPAGQPFRLGAGENLNQPALPNMNLNPNRPEGPRPGPGQGFGPEGTVGPNVVLVTLKHGLDMSPGVPQLSGNFAPSSILVNKQQPGETANKNLRQISASPQKQNLSSEESGAQDAQMDLKGKNRGSLEGGVEKINGVLHSSVEPLKKSPQSGSLNEPLSEKNRRPRPSSRGNVIARNKAANHPSRSSNSTSEPLYPCGICHREVKDDQEAILCEASCQKWFHRLCTGMTETAYNLLTAEANAVWGCDSCMEDKPPQLVQTREMPGRPATAAEGQT